MVVFEQIHELSFVSFLEGIVYYTLSTSVICYNALIAFPKAIGTGDFDPALDEMKAKGRMARIIGVVYRLLERGDRTAWGV